MAHRVVSSAAANYGKIGRQIIGSSSMVSPIKAKGVLPGGFPYSAFNGTARIKPEAFSHIIENTRSTVFNKYPKSPDSLLDVDKLYLDYFKFIVSTSLEVDLRFHNTRRVKGPLSFESELEHLGKSSVQIKTSFYVDGLDDPMFISRVSSVFVCNKTRRPKIPPDWWVEKYTEAMKKHAPSDAKPLGKLDLSGGENSRSTESQFRINFSDVDPYRHANWSVYLRLCHDAFGNHLAETKGLDDGCDEFFDRNVKECLSTYLKESSINSNLLVRVSPESSAEDNDVFYFTIENDSKEKVYQSRIHYYPPAH